MNKETIGAYYQKLVQIIRYDRNSKNFVLMFHQICESIDESYDERYSIERSSFIELIHSISKVARFCTVNEIFEKPNDDCCRVVITFDDVFEGVFTLAYPYLRENNIPFYVFPTLDYINKKGYITSDMLQELGKDDLCIIGTHTMSHPILRKLNRIESKRELVEPQKILKNASGRTVSVVAYPYGSFYAVGAREKRIAKKHYDFAFTTLQIPLHKGLKKNSIPRINVNEENWEKWMTIICQKQEK